MSSLRTIIITGCNRGLGQALVKLLVSSTPHKVIMTARNSSKGDTAFETLKSLYPSSDLHYHDLDVSQTHSVQNFAKWLSMFHGSFDVLVNNAVVALDQWSKTLASEEVMKETLETNFYGLMQVTEALHPLLSSDGKIINISAMMALLNNHGSGIKQILSDPELTKSRLLEITKDYEESVRKKTIKDWNKSAYVVSKTLVNAYTRIIARDLVKNDQMAMSLCPGWCKTDLGGPKAPGKDEDGAKKMNYLILEIPFKKDEKINGKFFINNKVANP